MDLPYGETVTVLRKAPLDAFGDPVGPDISLTVTRTGIGYTSASISAASVSEESTGERETFVRRATWFAPTSQYSDSQAGDRVIRANGDEFEVIGKEMWDMPGGHPMNGWDPGYMMWRIQQVR